MNVILQKIKPEEIEAESFRIIESELGLTDFDPGRFAVARRVIHATGDFAFADNLRFHPEAIAVGIRAIQGSKNVLTDVNMVASGISKAILGNFGGKIFCQVADPKVQAEAKAKGLTRSEVAIARAVEQNIGIVAIGNAPTALLKVMEMIDQGIWAPDLVIGVPVGFVNAAEAKEILAGKNYPFITAVGRKGGSPVAAAMVNALLRLAMENK